MKALLSFFSGFPLSWYIIAILAGSLSLSLYVLQGKIEEIGGYKVAQESYVSALNSAKDSLEKKDESCKIDDISIVALNQESKDISSKSDLIENSLIALKNPVIKTSPKVDPTSKEITKDESKYLPDDGLLSPNIVSLLHQSFCNAEPTDSSCIASKKSSD